MSAKQIEPWSISVKGMRKSVIEAIEKSKAPQLWKDALKASIPECEACRCDVHCCGTDKIVVHVDIQRLF